MVLPLLLDMVSPSQAQDLYIGWALHQGGQLYSSYYASHGLLYYLPLYITQGGILFALVEWLALLGGGYFLFSSTDYLTGQREQAKQLLTIFLYFGIRSRFWRRLCYDLSSAIPVCRIFVHSSLSIKS